MTRFLFARDFSHSMGYDYKKTLKKVGRSIVIVGLTGAVALWQTDPKYMAFVPVVEGLLNWFKHRDQA